MPPKKEPCCLWIFRAEESSEKMLLKDRVLMPVDVLRVFLAEVSFGLCLERILTYPCMGSHCQTTV